MKQLVDGKTTYTQLITRLIEICTEANKDLDPAEIYGAVSTLEVFARVRLVQRFSEAGKTEMKKKVKK